MSDPARRDAAYDALAAQGAVSEMDILRLERQASQMQGEIETTKQAIPRAQSRIEESQMALRELKLAFLNKAKAELNEVSSQLGEDAASSIALKDRLDRTAIRSPVNGTVNRLLINTVGGVVQPGMNLVEIVPTEGTLLIEAKISPSSEKKGMIVRPRALVIRAFSRPSSR